MTGFFVCGSALCSAPTRSVTHGRVSISQLRRVQIAEVARPIATMNDRTTTVVDERL